MGGFIGFMRAIVVIVELLFGGAVILAPWGFLVGFFAGLMQTRSARGGVRVGARWALAVATIPAMILGLVAISLLMLPLWFIPILGWAICAKIIALYMKPWERLYRKLGINLTWRLRNASGSPVQYGDDIGNPVVEQTTDFAENQAKDFAEGYTGSESR